MKVLRECVKEQLFIIIINNNNIINDLIKLFQQKYI